MSGPAARDDRGFTGSHAPPDDELDWSHLT